MSRKGKRSKKGKPVRSPAKKLEARLLGYWKKEAWEEFITLYQRHRDTASKTRAASCWNPAIYNLLLKTLVYHQKIETLENVHKGLKQAPDLNSENTQCLHVVQVLIDVYHGRGYPGMAESLPRDLPDPFAELAQGLREILCGNMSALHLYVQGGLTRARKNEKHLSLAARAAREFNNLAAKNFHTASVKPLTRIRNHFQELDDYFSKNFQEKSVELKNLRVLAEAMHFLYSRPGNFIDPHSVQGYLHRSGFHQSSHPAVMAMHRAFLTLGGNIMGRNWKGTASYGLQIHTPEAQSDLPSHVQGQLAALSRIRKKDTDSFYILQELLGFDVWSERERMILLQARMQQMDVLAEPFFDYLFDLAMEDGEKQAGKTLKDYMRQSCSDLQEIAELYKKLGLSNELIISTPFKYWFDFHQELSFLDNYMLLDRLIMNLCDMPVPDSVFLGLIYKRAEQSPAPEALESLKKIQQKRAPLKVSHQEIKDYVLDLPGWVYTEKILRGWKTCLSREDYRFAIETLLVSILDHEYLSLYSPSYRNPDWFQWEDIPQHLLKTFLKELEPESPVFGLLNLSANTAGRTSMPANAKEASFFTQYMPPPVTLHKIILWMLTWPSSLYKNKFMAQLIKHNLEHFNRIGAWDHLVKVIAYKKMKVLAGMVRDIWAEKDLYTTLASQQDFQNAVKTMNVKFPQKQAKGGKKGKKQAPKKNSMLDLMQDQEKKSS